MPRFPPPPPPPPRPLRLPQPRESDSVNDHRSQSGTSVAPQAIAPRTAPAAGPGIPVRCVPPPPPPRSYGSSPGESLSGLTPPSAPNGPAASYALPHAPVTDHDQAGSYSTPRFEPGPTASTGKPLPCPPIASQSRFPPPPPQRLGVSQLQTQAEPPETPQYPHGQQLEQQLSDITPSPSPPSYVVDSGSSQPRTSPVPSDLTTTSSHYSATTTASLPSPRESPNTTQKPQPLPPRPPSSLPPPSLPTIVPPPPPPLQPTSGPRPTSSSGMGGFLPHLALPHQHHHRHPTATSANAPLRPPPPPNSQPITPPPPPPPYGTIDPGGSGQNQGSAQQMALARPVVPVPDLSMPQYPPALPSFAPSSSAQPSVARWPPGGPQLTGGRSSQPPQQQLRVSLEQLPRPPPPTFPQSGEGWIPVYDTRQTLRGIPPPMADTRFRVVDNPGDAVVTGSPASSSNANPLAMRPTFYQFPQHRGIWHETGDAPLGVLCSPLALHSEEYVPPPRVLPDGGVEKWRDPNRVPLVRKDEDGNGGSNISRTSGGPSRCLSCQAYPSPFSNDGSDCAVCGFRGRGQSLSTPYSTVDYEVDGPYVTREGGPVRPVFLYAIDVTSPHAFDYVPVLERAGADLHFHWQRQPPPQPQLSSSRAPPSTGSSSSDVPTTGGGIQQQAGTALPRIGVCLYSANGVFIHARHGRGQHAIASDVTEQPFCPLPLSDWTFELASEDGLRDWIGFLTGTLIHDIALGKEQLKGGNAYGLDSFDLSPAGAALHFVSDALRESGGRGTVLTWRRPNFGVGRLSHREERKAPAAGKIEDYTPYTPVQVLSKFKTPDDEAAATFYKKLGTECVSNRVSLDVVMHCDSTMGQTFFDLATLGELCRATCGSLLWLPSSDDWQGALEEALRHRVRRFEGYDAVFKLRTSTGIQVKSFLCNPGVVQESMLGSQELELSSVSAGTTIAVELDYRVGGIPKNNKLVVLQSALLYTTVQGKRRVRVSTLALPVSSSSREIFRSIDFSATAVMILRTNAARLHQIPAEENATPPRANARASVYHECLHVLTSYRRVSGSLAGAEQLLLPEALQLLPLFVMSLMKSPLLRPTLIMNPSFRPGRAFQGPAATVQSVVIRPSGDDRAYLHTYASQAGPATAMLLVYPRIYPVSGLESGAGDWVASPGPESSGYVYLPHPLRPSMEVLQDDGMYLIDSGLRIFLWMGKSVPESVKDQARSQPLWEWNPVAHRILWQLLAFNNADRGHPSEVRPVHPPLLNVFVRDGMPPTPTDSMVLDLTIEDAIGGEKEYQEFFMRIQNSIRNQLKAQQ